MPFSFSLDGEKKNSFGNYVAFSVPCHLLAMYGNSMHTKSLSKNVSENISNVFSGFERLLSCKQNALFDLI